MLKLGNWDIRVYYSKLSTLGQDFQINTLGSGAIQPGPSWVEGRGGEGKREKENTLWSQVVFNFTFDFTAWQMSQGLGGYDRLSVWV